MTNVNNYVSTFTYDSDGRLSTMTTPARAAHHFL